MGSSYGQFCPVAKAMELLDERWTLLVVRELVGGSRRFNDLRRGVPRMSPTLLSKRLRSSSAAGVVERREDGGEVRYASPPPVRSCGPVVEALGAWGIRWIGELGDEDLDPKLLLWDMHRNIDHDAVPAGRDRRRSSGSPTCRRASRDWWLVITPEEADVCDADPGHDVAVTVRTPLRTMVGSGAATSAGRTRCAPGTSRSRRHRAPPGAAALVHAVDVRRRAATSLNDTIPACGSRLPFSAASWSPSTVCPCRIHAFLRLLFRENWVVYAKPPFGGPEHVLNYLARYTHASPSPTIDWWRSRMIASHFVGKTMRTAANRRSSRSPQMSFCDDS